MTPARFVVVALACLATPVLAQTPPPAPPPAVMTAPPEAAQKARYQLRVMEGVLENAVQHGIRSLSRQVRVVTPEVIFFGAPARARGYRLDGFGVFFTVDVPQLRPSMVWTMRTLTQGAPEMARATSTLRKLAQQQADQSTRRDLEQLVKMVEAQTSPLGSNRVAATIAEGDPGVPAPVNPYSDLPDPEEAYETEVKRAIADAMLDYGTTLNVADGDVLAIAARSNEDVLSGNGYEVITVMMTIKGIDLNALRTGTATRDEVRRRIVIQEY